MLRRNSQQIKGLMGTEEWEILIGEWGMGNRNNDLARGLIFHYLWNISLRE